VGLADCAGKGGAIVSDQPTRYRLDVQGKNYLVAMVADSNGEYVDYRNYAALQAENELLRKAGDAMAAIIRPPAHGPGEWDGEYDAWHAAKEGQS